MTKAPLDESNCRGQPESAAARGAAPRAIRTASATSGFAAPIERVPKMGRDESISCLLEVQRGERWQACLKAHCTHSMLRECGARWQECGAFSPRLDSNAELRFASKP